jgi:hypothetical protein
VQEVANHGGRQPKRSPDPACNQAEGAIQISRLDGAFVQQVSVAGFHIADAFKHLANAPVVEFETCHTSPDIITIDMSKGNEPMSRSGTDA